MKRCWAGTGLGSHRLCPSPERAPAFFPGETQGGDGDGDGRGGFGAGSAQHRPSVPGSCALGGQTGPPGQGGSGRAGGSGGRGTVPARAVGGRQAPAKHYFQSVLSGRICSGTIYFPVVTALADDASVADPKPCSRARFLIRKRI